MSVKGSWSAAEDDSLIKLVKLHGPHNWSEIAAGIPGRSGKSCRLRWCNQLSPEIHHRPFTPEEDDVLIREHARHGNKWAMIARMLPGRSDNAVKNHWNSTLRRKCPRKLENVSDPPGDLKRLRLSVSVVDCGVWDGRSGATRVQDKEASNGPETMLTLMPPHGAEGDKKKSGGDDIRSDLKRLSLGEDEKIEMRRLIAEEVRDYIDRLVQRRPYPALKIHSL